ncbi:MAG TPA: hypothetical protein VMS09_12440 [Paenibacillus sp.]|uniref:hypothetical protein n=1 Tax=Paenibacillus sp. TaxID=58172 RepID=UPI0028D1C505|nr:hypothetical protein [Paenibacillus sp.]HUC92814.1 hypothetical protein [Paenibacillus sp.]
MTKVALAIMPLDDFLKLDTDEQVERLKRYKIDYTLKDIRDAWGFKHSAQYYMLLKKLRIYERVVNKSDKFHPDQLLSDKSGEARNLYQLAPVQQAPAQREDHFSYQLNVTVEGPDLADKLERIAHFLKGENKRIRVKLLLEAEEREEESESAEEV